MNQYLTRYIILLKGTNDQSEKLLKTDVYSYSLEV